MRVAIISDTHLPRGTRTLPQRCIELIEGADLLLHAGDVSTAQVLTEIEAIGPPVAAVHGNIDDAELQRRLSPERVVEAGGARIAMLHDAGPRGGRLTRMRLRFPDAHAVVFGHSHTPLHEEDHGFQIFNPGSPTDRRRQPRHTMGIATVEDGRVRFEHVPLD